MVRKLLAACLLLFVCCGTALADEQVIDDAGLFSLAETVKITQIIDEVEKKHQVDLAVLTTNDVPYDYSDELYILRDYADDFYDQNGYGMGPDDSGLLLVIDMNNRAMWISTAGVMREYIDDSREEQIFDDATPWMRSGAYGQATIRAMESVSRMMNTGREAGTFLYDEVTGERLSGVYNPLTTGEMGFAAIAGAAVALIIALSVRSGYSLQGSTYSYDVSQHANIDLTRDSETFLRKSVSRTARSTSSGGVSHGGGGRRF